MAYEAIKLVIISDNKNKNIRYNENKKTKQASLLYYTIVLL